LKVPSGYSSNFKRLVSLKDMKMNVNLMKSHDCHVLMTALLPAALRGVKTEMVHDAVTSLCLFFNAIEQKVNDEEKLLDLKRRHFETLCLLEATFPPSFFDLMLHLTAHLTREILFLGPYYLCQMFPYERFCGFLKSLVHNRLFSEGAIVRGYETIEALEWAMG
jgi:Na+/pantothenate symporter